MMACDLCHKENERVDKSVKSYICSVCVQILSNSPQDSLKRAYDLAIKHGYNDKARAIQSFMEVSDEPDNKHTAKRTIRKRAMRIIRHDKGANRSFKKSERTPLHKTESDQQALF